MRKETQGQFLLLDLVYSSVTGQAKPIFLNAEIVQNTHQQNTEDLESIAVLMRGRIGND